MVVVALLSVDLVESVDLVSVDLVVNCILPFFLGSTRKQVFSLDSELSKYLLFMYFFLFQI